MLAFALLGLLGFGLIIDLVSDGDDDVQAEVENTTMPTDEEPVDTRQTGTDELDNFDLGDGDDRVFARGGNDLVTGAGGDDSIFGGDGDDLLLGEEGDDFIRGGAGSNLVTGGRGEDTLIGDNGNDFIFGADIVDEDTYIETIRSTEPTRSPYDFDRETAEMDVLSGGFGDDLLVVGSNDVATGGEGNDTINAGFWMNAGEAAIVTDYDSEEDVLIYTHDINQRWS